jgi:hypothetical protein
MADFVEMRGNGADAITGERITPKERVFDTGIRNKRTPYINNSRNRVLKEATIVWLAEEAGYTLTKRDAGNLSDTKVVDGEDAITRGGKAEAGEPTAGGKPPTKRRASGTTKSK